MHRHFYGAFAQAEARREFGVRRAGSARRERILEQVERSASAGGNLFLPQPGKNLVEQRQRPATLEKPVGAEVLEGFDGITLLGRQRIERNRSTAATAFPGARLVPFIGQKTFQRD